MALVKYTVKEGTSYRMLSGLRRKLRNSSLRQNLNQMYQNKKWSKLPKASLWKEIKISDFAPTEIFFIQNKNGSKDLLLLRTQGIFESQIYKTDPFKKKLSFLTDENVFGLRRIDWDGNIKWEIGESHKVDQTLPYCSHASEEMLTVNDIDYDGKKEIIVINNDKLYILDADKGSIKNEVALKMDNFGVVKVIEDRQKKMKRILVSVMADAYEGYNYASPTILLDSNLNQLKEFSAVGSGHRLLVLPDANDRDKFLDGYEMFNFDGERLWILDEFIKREYNPKKDHIDHTEILKSGEGYCAAIAGSDYFYFVDISNGKTLWKNKPLHAQYCLAGNYGDKGQTGIFLTNMTYKVQFYNLEGKISWEGELSSNWPKGKPRNISGKIFHMGIPANKVNSNDKDQILYNEKGWPYVIDEKGNTVLVFPTTGNVKKDAPILPNHRADDFGFGFYSRTEDIDNDGIEEVLIFDRRYIWIYKI